MYTACHDSNKIEESLEVVSVDPVQEVETAVRAQSKQVVTCDGFSLTRLAHHEQLRQDGYRLQIDRKCPQNLYEERVYKLYIKFIIYNLEFDHGRDID